MPLSKLLQHLKTRVPKINYLVSTWDGGDVTELNIIIKIWLH